MDNISGVIFDVDGTLLDSMHIWERVEIDYLESQGITPRPGMNELLRSYSEMEVAIYFRAEYGVKESVEEIIASRHRLISDFYFNRATLKSGVIPVLDALRARGIRMCVATATDKSLIVPALRHCGVHDFFGKVFTCGEERTSKSSPDIFIRAADFLGTDVCNTLVVEDALYAIVTAKRAGFPVAAVYDLSADDQQDEIKELCDYYWLYLDEMLKVL